MTDMTLAQFKEKIQKLNEHDGPDEPQFFLQIGGEELLGISARFPTVHFSDVLTENYGVLMDGVDNASQGCVIFTSEAASLASGVVELAVNSRQKTFAFFKVYRAVEWLKNEIENFRYH